MQADCLFCNIVAGDLDADIVFENADVVGFRDMNGQAPLHVLFVPRRHVATLNDVEPADAALLGKLMVAASEYAGSEGHAQPGYRVVMNCNERGGQSVFHIHLHLLAGRQLDWPPG